MSNVTIHEAGSFQFIPGGLFSLGVAALPGYELHRVRFRQPQALGAGFRVIADYLQKQGRPLTALAACELRSPAALTRADFNKFNNYYVDLLTSLGFSGQIPYPIGRSNLAPLFNPPTECALFAFSFTTPIQQESIAKPVDFVISGKPEIIEEPPGGVFGGTDVSAEGLIGKAAFIMQALRQRVTSLGAEWSSVNGAQIYTVHPLEAVISSVFAGSGLTNVGLTLFPSYPPVLGMEFEVDVRAVSRELVL
ncbi:hypothetical protein LJR290_006092 [Variovorax sp. LjRoot290]|uniref:2-amino-5-chloromuconate deaminase CnbZ n=1 Tax=unclassified Variovorax TaxID=663243 RepID=UPI003ECD2675